MEASCRQKSLDLHPALVFHPFFRIQVALQLFPVISPCGLLRHPAHAGLV
jgi:hypothetical protein